MWLVCLQTVSTYLRGCRNEHKIHVGNLAIVPSIDSLVNLSVPSNMEVMLLTLEKFQAEMLELKVGNWNK